VAHVVQIDFRQARLLGELLESAGDGVGVGRRAVLPAEQPAAIMVVRPELPQLLVELVDMGLEGGERERVEGQEVLGVLGLAVRLDHLAVDHDASHPDAEGAAVEVKATALCAAAPGRAHGGRAAWRPVPPQRAGQAGYVATEP
jgi:hypothetical protein